MKEFSFHKLEVTFQDLSLTFFGDSFHQHVQLIHKHFLLAVHHPAEAFLQRERGTCRVIPAALQLVRCLVTYQSMEFWDIWEKKTPPKNTHSAKCACSDENTRTHTHTGLIIALQLHKSIGTPDRFTNRDFNGIELKYIDFETELAPPSAAITASTRLGWLSARFCAHVNASGSSELSGDEICRTLTHRGP